MNIPNTVQKIHHRNLYLKLKFQRTPKKKSLKSEIHVS